MPSTVIAALSVIKRVYNHLWRKMKQYSNCKDAHTEILQTTPWLIHSSSIGHILNIYFCTGTVLWKESAPAGLWCLVGNLLLFFFCLPNSDDVLNIFVFLNRHEWMSLLPKLTRKKVPHMQWHATYYGIYTTAERLVGIHFTPSNWVSATVRG